jgi:hypothetical protein
MGLEDRNLAKFEFAGGNCSIDLVSGNVQAGVSYNHSDFEGSVSLKIKTKAGLEHLKQIIPGGIDDKIIDIVIAILGL